MPQKKPRFFCDNCGAEVDQAAKSCPTCGRYFASVRCPKCGYTGRDEDFAQGCPVCGYSAPPAGGPPAGSNNGGNSKKGPPWRWERGKRAPQGAGGSLPVWMYVLAALILICVLVILYNSLQ